MSSQFTSIDIKANLRSSKGNLSLTGFTPMIQQYLKIKSKIPNTILFFRLGDFYEMFFEDAKLASQILNITLTSREAGKNKKVPMCGIPYHAASSYIKRLVKVGKKVAICEQVEDPKVAKGIVKREITRIITPGTWIEEEFDEPGRNYLLSLNKNNTTFGIAWVELSTGEFKITQIDGIDKLILELNRIKPSECLIPESLKDTLFEDKRIKIFLSKVITPYFDWAFEYNTAYSKLISHFNTSTLRGFGCDGMEVAIGCAGASLRYLEETQKVELSHIKKLTTYSISDFMILDETTQSNLEIITSLDKDKKNSLFGVMDRTTTSMGKRRLMDWILHPLLDIEKINERLEAVEELVKKLDIRDKIRDILTNIRDIEKILAKMSLGWSSARDLVALSKSLQKIPLIKNKLQNATSLLLSNIKNKLHPGEEVIKLIDSSIADEPPLSIREGGIIRDGFNKELDELRNIVAGGKNWIAELQKKEIERTGIQSLKVKFNKVFGYYIEVTKPNLKYIPEDYIRKQTLVNAERFITPELKEYETKVLGAEEKIVRLEYKIFCDIQSQVLKHASIIQEDAQLISILDVLTSLAYAAISNRWIKPEIDNSDLIDIKQSRHPVLEKNMSSGKFVPNDCLLDPDNNRLLLITGPNMAGKSTYLRQIALIVVMAQIGSFIPAASCKIGIVDRIFTRVGAQDKITKGISTFMLEMLETANILNNATDRSLIILDEIGRGTSTFDGVSIAWACAEYIHNNLKGARTLFATHYHELTQALSDFQGVKNYYLQVKEWQDEVIFLYKLAPGGCDKSFGIYVARLAGIPKDVVKRARQILSSLEISNIAFSKKVIGISTTERKEYQLDLFTQSPNPIIEELKKLDLDNLTPIDALNKLNQWKKKLK